MSNGGRPRVLDDIKRGQVCALIAAGCGMEVVARYVSCSASTIRREALRNADFRKNLRSSEVQAQISPLQAMRAAANTHWRAAAWLLERTNPQQFARNRLTTCKPQELHDIVDAVVEKAVEEIPDSETRDRICRQLLATAYRASRALSAEEHSRLDPRTGPFEMPLSRDDRDLQRLLDELNRDRRVAVNKVRNIQNPARSA